MADSEDQDETYTPLGELLAEQAWPSDYFGVVDLTFLNTIAYIDGDVLDDADGTRAFLNLQVVAETVFDLPFSTAIVVGGGPINATFDGDDAGFQVSISTKLVRLRLPRDLFVPVIDGADGPEPDPDPDKFTEIAIPVGVSFDDKFNFDIAWPEESGRTALALPRCMLGQTGFVIQAQDVIVRLSSLQDLPDDAADVGLGPDFRGLFIGEAKVEFPPDLADAIPIDQISFKNCFIGTGGFSGDLTFTGEFDGSFLGSSFKLTSLDIGFRQSVPSRFELKGSLKPAGFDTTLDITVGMDSAGKLTVDVSRAGGPVKLTKDPIIDIGVDHVAFEVTTKGLLTLMVSGTITPLYLKDQIKWPSLKVDKLSIDSDGKISVAGGWVDVPNHASFHLYSVTIEVTKIGFGNEDDTHRWIGFSGGVKVVDGLKAGASVKGLRIIWTDAGSVSLSLEGVGIELEIPNALIIKGSVSLVSQEFRGAVTVSLPSISFTIEGQFVAGSRNGNKYFAIFLRGELPAGIPLGPTGLAIYGMAGLYAHNMAPDKKAAEGWYENPDHSPGWYLRPTTGVSDLAKWADNPGHFGVGAGVTLGTFSDNGFTFSGRLLLVLSFPGPIILLEGKMNLFKKRAELDKGDPLFRALAVIEPGKSFLVGLDARYKYKNSGELMDIRGSAEAFFDFQNTENWHINIGLKDDPKKRVAAKVFKLFDVNGYFQLNHKQLDVGASWGFDKSYGFSALNVHVKDTMETAATVSWHPNHFSGSVTAQGGAELRAFGFHTGVSANATLTGDVFDPFHINGKFHVGIDLPWPLDDIGATVTLDWKRPLNHQPPLPLPLQEASVEFVPKGLRWPARRGRNLLPNADQGGGEFGGDNQPPSVPTSFNFQNALLVPADTDLGLTFSRPIDDPAQVGVNHVNKISAEQIGNPQGSPAKTGFKVGYSLSSVVLEKVAALGAGDSPGSPLPAGQGIGWITVAQKGRTGGIAQLYGAWSPALPQHPGDQPDPSAPNNAQAKLMINAKSPFKYTAYAAKSWNDAFLGASPGYPCIPADPNVSETADFKSFTLGQNFGQPGQIAFSGPAFVIFWQYGGKIVVGARIFLGENRFDTKGLEVASPVIVDSPLTSSAIRIRVPDATDVVFLTLGTPMDDVSHDPLGQYGVFADDVTGGGIDAAVDIESFDPGGTSIPTTVATVFGTSEDPHKGLHVAADDAPRLELTPEVPATTVEVQIFGGVPFDSGPTPSAEVHFLDADGADVPGSPSIAVGPGQYKFRRRKVGIGGGDLGTGVDIAKVVVIVTAGEFVVEKAYFRTPVVAVATTNEDPSLVFGPFTEDNGQVRVEGPNLKDIFLSTPVGGEFVILALTALSKGNEAVSHTIESLALFEQDDAVLEPDTNYRLTVRTKRAGDAGSGANANPDATKVNVTPEFVEQVYLRTAPLPGIGVPAIPEGTAPPGAAATTGFEDLGFYVKRTVPEIPPPAGGHTSPARAVYRAYDVTVEFDPEVDHVQLMYRLGRRDLSLRLYDGNSRPLLDAAGRAILSQSQWGRSNNPAISAPAAQWIEVVSTSTCAVGAQPVNTQNMRGEDLSAPAEEAVLAAETLHQARLVPMLLHEAFVNADVRPNLVADGKGRRLESWQAQNSGSTAAAAWTVKSETVNTPGGKRTVWWVTEGSGIQSSSLVYEGPLASIDNTTAHDHPSQWRDFRASLQIRWAGAGEVGIEVRRGSSGLLRVSVFPGQPGEDPIVQLASVTGSGTSVLGQAHRPIPAGEDTTLIVDCTGPAIRVFQHGLGQPDGPVAISVDDAPVFSGTVALFSSGTTDTRFSEIRVDDLRDNPSTAYRIDFITSKYANFFHHLQSFDDRLFDPPNGRTLDGGTLGSNFGAAIDVPGTPGSAPGLGKVEQPEARAFDALEEVTLGDAKLQPPERLEILRASPDGQTGALLVRSPEPLDWLRTQLSASSVDGALALGLPGDVKITGATFSSSPAGESVTLLVRAATNLTGRIIEWRLLPDLTTDPDPAWNLYYTFGSEAPFEDGTRVQIFSGDASGAPDRAPGTEQRFVAATPSDAVVHFTDERIELRLRVPGGDILHQRQVRVDDVYVPFDMSAIRKPDGTAFFLFPFGGAPLPAAPAALRLSFTFARNAGQTLPVLRQGGDSSAESALLDVEMEE
jgi:hypothetical protein